MTPIENAASRFACAGISQFELTLIQEYAKELAERHKVFVPTGIPYKVRGLSIVEAKCRVSSAAIALAHAPKKVRGYLDLGQAIAQFHHSLNLAHEARPSDPRKKTRSRKKVHAPERPAFIPKHAPRQAVLECSSGSAAMANRPIPEPRSLTKEQATAMVTIARYRYYDPKLCTRQQIAAIENEVLAMNKDQLARWLAISSGRGRFIDLRNI